MALRGPAPVESALGAAVDRLTLLAHPCGTWTDFWLAPGASSSWVTAYTGVALARAADDERLPDGVREQARHTAEAAADALLATGRDGSWGWSASVRPDADSTAWAARLLTATGRQVPVRTWAFLERHRTGPHVRTYVARGAGAWREPAPEVTAATLLALAEAGRSPLDELARRWTAAFGPGPWRSPWWPTRAQPTAVVLSAWAALGRPGPAPDLGGSHGDPQPRGPGERAAALWGAACVGDPRGLHALLTDQQRDGQWPGSTVLLVPAANATQAAARTIDARGVFTTATALHALLACPEWPATSVVPRRAPRRDLRWDPLLRAVARSQGVEPATVGTVVTSLTAESLAAPSPWPAEQLSTLAGGLPLELSVTGTVGLRLACDVGDPRLPPHRRLASGREALDRTAALLGLTDGWDRACRVLDALAPVRLPVPDGCRFWLWGGAALTPRAPAVLKAYAALHAAEVPGWAVREAAALRAAGVPDSAPVHRALAVLRTAGWCHQIGVGVRQDGRWGLKVYYELPGWQPALVEQLLRVTGLPADVGSLTPEVPGVLSASMARHRRSGISLRVDPGTGAVREVTVTAAVPPPLVGRDELDRRVLAWLPSVGVDPGPLAALLTAVAPTWSHSGPTARRLSLFTRSLSADARSTTVYVRPGARTWAASPVPAATQPGLVAAPA